MELLDVFNTNLDIQRLDDIMDGSLTRKNAPAAHVVFGVPFTMNSGLFALTHFAEEALKFCPEKGPEIYSRNIAMFFRGTGIEINWRDQKYCPTLFEYMTVAMDKWFTYMDISGALMKIMRGSDHQIEEATRVLSWFFSIINDYSDFVRSPLSEGKNFCEDMAEGKFTFPVIHAIKEKENMEVYGENIS
jgi:geranylgeranyl diphosphate synthase, type III